MTDVVKYFHSGMAGAPQMANVLGQMISVLDGCLKDGFNSLTPTSITRSGSTATATYGANHGYEIDQVILVTGCDQAAYNGEKRILSVPSPTTLTFAVAGTPTTPATSGTTFNTKAAPLGFIKPFSATNKAMYQSQNVTSNQWILRVDGTANTAYSSGKGVEYQVDICRTASGIDTMTDNTTAEAGATYGRFRWKQTALNGSTAGTAPITNVNWALYGNDKTFFLTVGWHSAMPLNHSVYGFGEVDSFAVGDAFNTFLMADNHGASGGATSTTVATAWGFRGEHNRTILAGTAAQSDIILAKSHTGIGGWVQGGFSCIGVPNTAAMISGGVTGNIDAINPQDYSILFFKSYVTANSGFRGKIPAIHAIPNQLTDLISVTDFGGVKYRKNVEGVDKVFRVCRMSNGTQSNATAANHIAFDIIGPW